MPELSGVTVEGTDLVIRLSITDKDIQNELDYASEAMHDRGYIDIYSIQDVLRRVAGISDSGDLSELSVLIQDEVEDENDEDSGIELKASNPQVRSVVMEHLKDFVENRSGLEDYILDEAYCYLEDGPLIDLLENSASKDPSSTASRIEAVAKLLGDYIDRTPRGEITRGNLKKIVSDNLAKGTTTSCHKQSVSTELGAWEPK